MQHRSRAQASHAFNGNLITKILAAELTSNEFDEASAEADAQATSRK